MQKAKVNISAPCFGEWEDILGKRSVYMDEAGPDPGIRRIRVVGHPCTFVRTFLGGSGYPADGGAEWRTSTALKIRDHIENCERKENEKA